MSITKKILIIFLVLIFSSFFVATTLASNIFPFYYTMITRIISDDNLQDGSMRSMMAYNNNNSNNMMFITMMNNEEPEDVIIKIISNQKIPVGKESEISFLVLDKETKKSLTNSQVIIGVERGASMTTMDMVSSMVKAEENKIKGSGIYTFKFTPDRSGYYTIHTHVIPSGKSMHSMMDNHLDIGIIVE